MRKHFKQYYFDILKKKFNFECFAINKYYKTYNHITYDINYFLNFEDENKDMLELVIINKGYRKTKEYYTSYDNLTKRLNKLFRIELRKNKLKILYDKD